MIRVEKFGRPSVRKDRLAYRSLAFVRRSEPQDWPSVVVVGYMRLSHNGWLWNGHFWRKANLAESIIGAEWVRLWNAFDREP
jgi:hypothetical protein